MSEQMSILDFMDKKTQRDFIPELWFCMDTCSNYNCKFENGSMDYFPSTHEPRCVNAVIDSKLSNNIWSSKCKNYKWREPS